MQEWSASALRWRTPFRPSSVIQNFLRDFSLLSKSETMNDDSHHINKALTTVLQNLPKCLVGKWMDLLTLHTELKRGGLGRLPVDVLRTVVRTTRMRTLHRDKLNNKRFVLFGSFFDGPSCYKDQASMCKSTI